MSIRYLQIRDRKYNGIMNRSYIVTTKSTQNQITFEQGRLRNEDGASTPPLLRHQWQSMKKNKIDPQKSDESLAKQDDQFYYCRYCGRKGLKPQIRTHEREDHDNQSLSPNVDFDVSQANELKFALVFSDTFVVNVQLPCRTYHWQKMSMKCVVGLYHPVREEKA